MFFCLYSSAIFSERDIQIVASEEPDYFDETEKLRGNDGLRFMYAVEFTYKGDKPTKFNPFRSFKITAKGKEGSLDPHLCS